MAVSFREGSSNLKLLHVDFITWHFFIQLALRQERSLCIDFRLVAQNGCQQNAQNAPNSEVSYPFSSEFLFGSPLGGSSQLGYVVNNHGDRKSPKWGCSPYKWPKWLVNRGY